MKICEVWGCQHVAQMQWNEQDFCMAHYPGPIEDCWELMRELLEEIHQIVKA